MSLIFLHSIISRSYCWRHNANVTVHQLTIKIKMTASFKQGIILCTYRTDYWRHKANVTNQQSNIKRLIASFSHTALFFHRSYYWHHAVILRHNTIIQLKNLKFWHCFLRGILVLRNLLLTSQYRRYNTTIKYKKLLVGIIGTKTKTYLANVV